MWFRKKKPVPEPKAAPFHPAITLVLHEWAQQPERWSFRHDSSAVRNNATAGMLILERRAALGAPARPDNWFITAPSFYKCTQEESAALTMHHNRIIEKRNFNLIMKAAVDVPPALA